MQAEAKRPYPLGTVPVRTVAAMVEAKRLLAAVGGGSGTAAGESPADQPLERVVDHIALEGILGAADQRAPLGVKKQDLDLDRPLLLALADPLHLSPQQAIATQQRGHLRGALIIRLGTLSLPLRGFHANRGNRSLIHAGHLGPNQLLIERSGNVGQQEPLGRQKDELHLLARRGWRRGWRRRRNNDRNRRRGRTSAGHAADWRGQNQS